MVLDQLMSDPTLGVPIKLLANRLALGAATATSKFEGRLAHASALRDAFHFTAPGEARGPDGDLLAFWRNAAKDAVDEQKLARLIGPDFAAKMDHWLNLGESNSVSRGAVAGCITVLWDVLTIDDRAERVACLLADVVLARVLRWPTVLPITAHRMTKSMLRDLAAGKVGADVAAQARMLAAIETTIRQAQGLARRARALRDIAPKLRTKGAQEAVQLFLTEDAVAPGSMLSPFVRGTSVAMTSRAARRLCDRLVELNVATELTGRATFRLYGL